ncbi:MAG: M12 family metallo-peptidase [Planctomycetota bacterium]
MRRTTLVCAAALLLSGVLAADQPARRSAPSTPPPDRPGSLEATVGVETLQVQRLATARLSGAEVAIDLRLDGIGQRLVMRPHSVRSEGFRLLSAKPGGRLVELPAPPPRTYRGTVDGMPDSAVAASIVDGRITAWISTGETLWGVEPLARHVPGADDADHVVYRRADVLPDGVSCGVEAVEGVEVDGAGGAVAGSGAACSISVAQLAIDTDFPFYEQSGGTDAAALADVDAIINAVDLIYTRDVSIRYAVTSTILRQTEEDDPYTASSIFQLLGQFRELWNTLYPDVDRDVAHLLSGRPHRGVIGVASLGVICNMELAYGVSLSHWTTNFVQRVGLTAHELGHNWNAIHCDLDNDCWIMCSSISGCNQDVTRFGTRSVGDITVFRDSRTCLNAAPPVAAPLAKLLAEENGQLVGELGDQFGRSLALDADMLMVGAWGDDEPPDSDVGAVYVHEFGQAGWETTQRIVPLLDDPNDPNDDGAGAFDRFGGAVAMQGTLALVGAPTDDGQNNTTRNAGAVYAFELSGSTWQETALLRPSDGSGSDQFGAAIALTIDGSGTTWAVVGAPFDDVVPINSGSIYILRHESGEWTLHQKMIPLDAGPNAEFGTAVAIDFDPVLNRVVIVVGAPGSDENGDPDTEDGTVYVFVPESSAPDALFVQDQKFVVATVTGDDDQNLGQSVDIDVDEELGLGIIAGASGADRLAVNAGAAYVYRFDGIDTWMLEDELTRINASPGDSLGSAVALKGSLAAVGARLADNPAVNAGAVNVFGREIDEKTQMPIWLPRVNFAPVPGQTADLLGTTVTMDDVLPPSGPAVLQIISGATGDSTQGTAAGAVYAFGVDELIVDCNGNDFPDECDILSGSSADCNGNDVPDECDIAENPDLDVNPVDGVIDVCQDCNDNGVLDIDELAGNDCNGNGILDECDISSGESQDTNANGLPDECEEDCNSNGIPDLLEPDCNGNGIPDDCDIDSGFSSDCNLNDLPDSCDIIDGSSSDLDGNGVPDECDPDCDGDGLSDFTELLFGFEEDCNLNSLPDSCDIANQTSMDVNGNGIPDECECLADFDGSGVVDIVDLLGLLSAWGTDDATIDIAPDPPDGIVDIQDLLALLAAWGDCV